MLARISQRDALIRLGRRVRRTREERGLTQGALAELLAMSVAYVGLIERGRRNPSFTTFVAVARALGLSPRDLCID
jgi:transcriptional regulator with XRE-family HTH domain